MIRETDRQIQETFEETFAAAARNFEELAGDVFPVAQAGYDSCATSRRHEECFVVSLLIPWAA